MEIGYGRLLGGGRGGGGKEVAGAKRPLFLANGTRNTFEVCFYDVIKKCVSAQVIGCAILVQLIKSACLDFESYKFLRDHVTYIYRLILKLLGPGATIKGAPLVMCYLFSLMSYRFSI